MLRIDNKNWRTRQSYTISEEMAVTVPCMWMDDPPRSFVVGDGTFACALAQVVAGSRMATGDLLLGPKPNSTGGFPRVLGELVRVFIVADVGQCAADLLRIHDATWNWVERLSPEGDQHELSVIFVVPTAVGDSFGASLAAGLGLRRFTPETPGHGLIRMDTPLPDLLAAVAAIPPQDLPPLRARQAADVRHAALKALLQAPAEEVAAAARRVNEAFHEQDYLLDLFCRPPCHQNGNQLRGWLHEIVTNSVTPDIQEAALKEIHNLLA